MRWIWLTAILAGTYAHAQTPQQQLIQLGTEFDLLQDSIRDGQISKPRALSRCIVLLPAITKAWKPFSRGDSSLANAFRVFPVKGYSYNAIGGVNGSGYIAKGYNFLTAILIRAILLTIFLSAIKTRIAGKMAITSR